MAWVTDEEKLTVWERPQKRTTLADDQKTRFQKNDMIRTKRRAVASAEEEANIAERNKRREVWSGDSRTGGARSTSVVLTPELKELREKMVREKQFSAPASGEPLSPATVAAVLESWRLANPNYLDSAFNAANMANCVFTWCFGGGRAFSFEIIDEVHSYLLQNGYLELPRVAPRKRGDPCQAAPKVYPTFFFPKDISEKESVERVAALETALKETRAALSMPFDELKKEVQGQYKPSRPLMGNL